jgi:hypothetical protein
MLYFVWQRTTVTLVSVRMRQTMLSCWPTATTATSLCRLQSPDTVPAVQHRAG